MFYWRGGETLQLTNKYSTTTTTMFSLQIIFLYLFCTLMLKCAQIHVKTRYCNEITWNPPLVQCVLTLTLWRWQLLECFLGWRRGLQHCAETHRLTGCLDLFMNWCVTCQTHTHTALWKEEKPIILYPNNFKPLHSPQRSEGKKIWRYKDRGGNHLYQYLQHWSWTHTSSDANEEGLVVVFQGHL